VAGAGPQAVFAFWMVLLAAVAAWESKLPIEGVAETAKAKLAELSEIREALEAESELMASAGVTDLQGLMATPNLALGASDVGGSARYEQARQLLSQTSDDPMARLLLVRRIGCIYCQSQRHGFQAYNPTVQKSAALYDVLLHGTIQPLVGRDIRAPKRKVTSRMVEMAYDADQVLKDQGVEIPLYW